jgi:DEAD/DEAH box helicase domain-containing protein
MEIVQGIGRKGKINFVILFPSLRSNRSLMFYLLKQTTKRNIKTIAFSNSHLGAELLAFYASRQQISMSAKSWTFDSSPQGSRIII